ncbi:DivIVA domain-containing protein [Glycomyces sp. TRM65418]|uniref:DivIVA domain-containing protein n=1 Tax=Glycomyces sp. TRM65418 TaxID=2867006 RepID=UPI001CE64E4E|nr:DivIVA domain-containing protein [Glycomyces sp. TRM65418]MCC3765749.1 DivIVA domain-containing protein [Glycomyces sp. TRM65418]QZD55340.1 DivIVA domain-containing protein [Glycomyces sp. TRM65418]
MGFVLPLIVAVIGVWIAFAIVVWATGRDTLLDLSPAGAPPGLGDGEPVDEAAVASVKFDTGLRGYRTEQVDAALYRLAWEIGRRDEQLAVLRAKLDGAYAEPPADAEAFQEPAPDEAVVIEEPAMDEEALDEEASVADRGAEGAAPEREAGREDPGEATPRRDA